MKRGPGVVLKSEGRRPIAFRPSIGYEVVMQSSSGGVLPSVAGFALQIRPLATDGDAAAFRALNEEWITRYFELEPKDPATLGDPRGTILSRGGHIFLAHAGAEVVGCVALIAAGQDIYELSKMAVRPELHGQGIGRRILEYAIVQAKELQARSLFLGSSTKLPNAVHLYEQVGFRHVSPEALPGLAYGRADVFMQMIL